MPLYEFMCNNCSYDFEGLYPVGVKVCNIECPQCKQKSLKKLFSTFAVSSKGRSGDSFVQAPSTSSGSKCGGCAGGSCSTCH